MVGDSGLANLEMVVCALRRRADRALGKQGKGWSVGLGIQRESDNF